MPMHLHHIDFLQLGLWYDFCDCYHGMSARRALYAQPHRVVLMQSMTTGSETSPPGSNATSRSQVWDRYRAIDGCYDELMAADDSIRRHWQPFVDAMELLGGDEIRRR